MLAAQRQPLERHGGSVVEGPVVIDVVQTQAGVQVHTEEGREHRADVVVVAPGPGAVQLLPKLGIEVPVQPFLEQVVHFGDARRAGAHDQVPCLFDGATAESPGGIYAMPSPGIGYKVGLDLLLRPYDEVDTDRTPSPERTRTIASRVDRDLRFLTSDVLDEQLCTWTDSPDGRFIVDRLATWSSPVATPVRVSSSHP